MAEPLAHVTPGQPFIPSAKAWNRFIDTARTVDEQREIFGQPPIEGGGESSLRRLYITSDDGSGNPAPFYTGIVSGTNPFTAVPNADGTGTAVEVYWDNNFTGVLFTGQCFFASRLPQPIGNDRKWQVAMDGVSAWYGVEADGAITGGAGNVLLPYWRFCPGAAPSLATCRVPVVAGDDSFNVADGGFCDVAFNQASGEFHVTRAYCPPTE